MLILFNKPYRVLCQFTDQDGRSTLAEWIDMPGVYPAGRLDFDSEGLVVLTEDGSLQAKIANPRYGLEKTYRVQVEGIPDETALRRLSDGVAIGGRRTRPASAVLIPPPADLWPRDPPIRYRKSVPDAWIEITIKEGRNRQVRRMTAAVGHPALRLIRWRVGPWDLGGLNPGQWREASALQHLRR
jgi:23S rRNA pseudouridine2457 synthase